MVGRSKSTFQESRNYSFGIRNREKLETSLRYKLTTLKNELHPDVNAISTIEQQLRELVTKRLEGAKIRSRASWLEKG